MTATDDLTLSEPLAVTVASTLTSTDQADFEDAVKLVTVTSTTSLVGQAVGWAHLALAVSAVSTFTGTDTTFAGKWPTTVSGHHILDQNSDPWFVKGDAGWEIFTELTFAEAEQYLEDRAAKGFNVVLCQMTDNSFSTNAPNNAANQPPFTGSNYASSLGDAYWDHVEAVVAKGAELGITFIACPAYLGINTGEGWQATISAVSNANMDDFGEALGARFKDYPNIIWAAGGDYNNQTPYDVRFDNMFTGLATAGDTHLRTYHSGPGSSANEVADSEPWLDVDTVYEYGQSNAELATSPNASWTNTPTRPAFFIEGRYEFENAADRADLRRQLYTPVFAGCWAGVIWGNSPIWHFNALGAGAGGASYDTWQESLNSPSTADVQKAWAFFNSLPAWDDLVPDTTDTFLTAGESTGEAIAGAAFSDFLGLVYVPTNRSITIDRTEFTPTVLRIRWFDPVAGTYTTVTTSAPNTGTQVVSHPGNNAGGDADWVLVVDASGAMQETGKALSITSTVTAPTDQGDFEDTGRALSITSTVTGTALLRFYEHHTVTVTSSTTSSDLLDLHELVGGIDVVSTVTAVEDVDLVDVAKPISIVSTVQLVSGQVDFDDEAKPVDIAATVTSTEQADYEDLARVVDIVSTVTGLDILEGAPIHYNETGRAVSITSTVTATDLRESVDALTISASVSVTLSGAFEAVEALQIALLAHIAIGDVGAFVEVTAVTVDSTVIGIDTVPDFADPYPRVVSHAEPPGLTYREPATSSIVHQE